MPIMLITLATFAILTTIALSVGLAVGARSPIRQRMQQLVGETPRPTRRGERAGLLGRLVAGLGNYAFGGDRSISHRLSVAGFRGPKATPTFLGVRTLISVGPALEMLVPAVSSGKPLGRALMTATFAGAKARIGCRCKTRTGYLPTYSTGVVAHGSSHKSS